MIEADKFSIRMAQQNYVAVANSRLDDFGLKS